MPRHGHGQLAARVRVADQRRDHGIGPLITGHPRHEDRGAAGRRVRDCQRPAREQHQHHRCARAQDRVEQLPLTARQAHVHPVSRLAHGGVVGQPGALAQDHDGQLGVAGRDGRSRDASIVAIEHPAASLVDQLDIVTQPGGKCLPDRAQPGQLIRRSKGVRHRKREGVGEVAHLQERLDMH